MEFVEDDEEVVVELVRGLVKQVGSVGKLAGVVAGLAKHLVSILVVLASFGTSSSFVCLKNYCQISLVNSDPLQKSSKRSR